MQKRLIYKKEEGETHLRDVDRDKTQCGRGWELGSPNPRPWNPKAITGEELDIGMSTPSQKNLSLWTCLLVQKTKTMIIYLNNQREVLKKFWKCPEEWMEMKGRRSISINLVFYQYLLCCLYYFVIFK